MAYYGTTQLESRRGTLSIERFPVAASQTLKVGNAVYLVNGLVTAFAAGDYDTTSNSTGGLLGFMAEDSSSQAVNTLVSVVIADDDLVVICRAVGTPTLAQYGTIVMTIAATTLEVQGKTTVASNGMFKFYALEFTDSGKRNGNKEIIGTIPANARLRCKVAQTARNCG